MGSSEQTASPLSERLTRLEEQVRLTTEFDRVANYQAWQGLQMQVNHLRAEIQYRGMGQPLHVGALVKLMVAALLPFLALLMTGSLDIARNVAAVGF